MDFERLKKSLDKKVLTGSSPGQIIQGVALGLPQYDDYFVKRTFREILAKTEYAMWDFIGAYFNPSGYSNSKLIRVNNTSDLYKKVIGEIRSQGLADTQELGELVNEFEGTLDYNNKAIHNAHLRFFSEYDSKIYVSGREKTVEKVAKKAALNLALAYAFHNNIRIRKNHIRNATEQIHIGKSRVQDFFGSRIVFKNMEDLILHLDLNLDKQKSYNIALDIGNKNTENFWGRQKLNGYKEFEVFKKNGYKAIHFDLKNPNYPIIKFELQLLILDWFIHNESSPVIDHKRYDETLDEVIAVLLSRPKDKYKLFYDRIHKFYADLAKLNYSVYH